MTGARPRHLIAGLLVALALMLGPAPRVLAQSPDTAPLTPETGPTTKPLLPTTVPSGAVNETRLAPPSIEEPATAPEAPDYKAWETLATRAETMIEDGRATVVAMDLVRAQLVDSRQTFLDVQSTNGTRIATLRAQIAALGPAPAEGTVETAEIAQRRTELNDQLARLQFPGIQAEEAYRRADGLIREIDRVLRERQADELLRLWPAPVNPANWPAAAKALRDTGWNLWDESRRKWATPEGPAILVNKLPAILVLLVVALLLLARGRVWVDRLVLRLEPRATARAGNLWQFLASLAQIVLPTLGIYLLASALKLTGLTGIVGTVVADSLTGVGFTIFTARWLGLRVFPAGPTPAIGVRLSAERRAEGRLLASGFGLMLGLDSLRRAAMDQMDTSQPATSVLTFPVLVVVGILLWRMGRLLSRHVANETPPGETPSYRNRLIGLLARGAVVIGVAGPALAAIGYVAAATALVFPAALTLSLVGLLIILQRLVADLYALVTRADGDATEALVPVLIGFGLTLASLPLFALIWGARIADITELWTRFREGFQLGETRISPTDFVVFGVIFGIGYSATRLFQGALRATILPKTTLDQGGQNAIVAGVGYLGIFLAGLVAINFAGIDLSGLAIVAGALSVGIGFGLQNIVSNFVSGIILLIERPVSEGDWIEVGPVQGIVRSISVRSTRIQTFDRSDVIVPNSDLIAGRVTNWTRYNLSGRLIVPVGVAFGSDTRLVERVLREIAEAQPLAILNPPPVVAFMGFGADSMNFEIRLILRDVNFSLAVRTEINHSIVERFAAEGIEIPFAQQEVTLRNVDALGTALRGMVPLADPPAATPPAIPPAIPPGRPTAPPGPHDLPAATPEEGASA